MRQRRRGLAPLKGELREIAVRVRFRKPVTHGLGHGEAVAQVFSRFLEPLTSDFSEAKPLLATERTALSAMPATVTELCASAEPKTPAPSAAAIQRMGSSWKSVGDF